MERDENLILQLLHDYTKGGGDFALVLSENNGSIKFSSSEAFKSCYNAFRDDIFGLSTPSSSPYPNQQQESQYRIKTALESHVIDINVSSENEVINHLRSCLRELKQLSCKAIAKAWIKAIEPKKQTNYPYNKGEEAKPPWWPSRIRHCEPDHLKMPERIDLMIGILRNKSVSKLREATTRIVKLTESQLKILDEIYMVVTMERQVDNGLVKVSDFDNGGRQRPKTSKCKQQLDQRELPDVCNILDSNFFYQMDNDIDTKTSNPERVSPLNSPQHIFEDHIASDSSTSNDTIIMHPEFWKIREFNCSSFKEIEQSVSAPPATYTMIPGKHIYNNEYIDEGR